MKDNIGIWTVRSEAEPLAQLLGKRLPATVPSRSLSLSNREAFTEVFRHHRQWILLMTTGIAVRYLQGLLEDKQTDPGVVVLDEAAHFAVALVGGHEGGANRLAYRVANLLGAIPVITTASEARKPLVLGIGCRKDIHAEQIELAAMSGLDSIGRSLSEVREVATVDLKINEPGLVAWCASHDLPLRSIQSQAIKDRSWVTKPSPWVKETLGLDGVCEPAALIASPRGRLLKPKAALDGVTIAIVEDSSSLGARPEEEV